MAGDVQARGQSILLASWPLRIEVDDLPPSPNRRMQWASRRRLVKPLADAVAWSRLWHLRQHSYLQQQRFAARLLKTCVYLLVDDRRHGADDGARLV